MPLVSAIRTERPADIAEIHIMNERSFGQPLEADLVDRIRQNHGDILSLVAVQGRQIVGHILFSPAVIESPEGAIRGMGLAPMAVLPEYRRQGIGSALVRHGLGILRQRKCPFVIVLGHPTYYPRFGFELASRYGIRCEWDVPDEAFMILLFDRVRMRNASGLARYLPEFAAAV